MCVRVNELLRVSTLLVFCKYDGTHTAQNESTHEKTKKLSRTHVLCKFPPVVAVVRTKYGIHYTYDDNIWDNEQNEANMCTIITKNK